MRDKICKGIIYVYYFSVLAYFLMSVFYFLNKTPGSGDESLFISDLDLIKDKGWIYAIEKNISIPYMVLSYPISLFMENYLALRLVNFGLLILMLFYLYKRSFQPKLILFGYLLFYLCTAYYFYAGTNDALFFIGLIVFINEVYLLQKGEKWNSSLAFSALILSFFTRKLIFVYMPVVMLCFYVIYKMKNKRGKINWREPILLALILMILNLPSIINNNTISYDLKSPPIGVKASWSQRQYLAQLMVNSGQIPNNSHPSWSQTDEYLVKNGLSSLPDGIIEGLLFDFKLTFREFFKNSYATFFQGFRQLGFILIVPVFFFFEKAIKERKISLDLLIPFSLLMMISIFSLIIISFPELRWLCSIFILIIIYFVDLQKNKQFSDNIYLLNYLVLFSLTIYGGIRMFSKL
jgi:hypothetical protein